MHRAKEPAERARNIAKKLAGVGKRKKSADPPQPAKRVCYSLDDLLHCQARKELSAVPLPPVAVSGRHKLLSTNEPTDDPFRVVSRPCERAVTQAIQQLIRTEGKNAVTLPPLGTGAWQWLTAGLARFSLRTVWWIATRHPMTSSP